MWQVAVLNYITDLIWAIGVIETIERQNTLKKYGKMLQLVKYSLQPKVAM